MKKLLILLSFILSFLLSSCTKDTPVTNNGNGSEAGNAMSIYGKLTDSSGHPVSGAIVRLFPVDYVPSFSMSKIKEMPTDTSDSNGNFKVHAGDTGKFNLESSKDTLGLFVDSVEVPDDTLGTNLSSRTMKKLGTITGISHMPGKDDTTQVRVTIYMPGTRRITKPAIGGKFTFDDVPEGRYQIIFDPTLNDFNVKVVDTTVSAGDTVDLDTIIMPTPDTLNITGDFISGRLGPDKTYLLNNDISIPKGTELRIEAGTTVLFIGPSKMHPVGKLIATGTAVKPIKFLSNSNNWSIIAGTQADIDPSPSDSIIFNYCVFENFNTISFFFERDTIPYIQLSNSVLKYGGQGFRVGLGYVPSHVNWAFYNNIFHNLVSALGVNRLADSMANSAIKIRNNIFFNDSAILGGTWCHLPEQSCLFNFTRFYYEDSISTPSLSNCIIIDPNFVSIEKGNEDYHLQPGSPCIGAGVNGTDMGIYSTYNGE